MNVLSSSPVSSSASKSMPTPSSTAAIIAARSRISSCSPEWIASRSSRDSGRFRSSIASAHAGFCFTTSAGGSMFGFFGKTQPW